MEDVKPHRTNAPGAFSIPDRLQSDTRAGAAAAPTVYDAIDAELDKLYDQFRDIDCNLLVPLFHFTDIQGLLGIIRNNTLWASNTEFLNDASEPRYALEVLKKVVDQVVTTIPVDSSAKEALANVWTWAEHEYLSQGPHLYGFCLSEHSDLLSQINKREPVIGEASDEERSAVQRRLKSAFLSEIIRLRGKFKTAAFEEESEWRVVRHIHPAVSEKTMQFRSGAHSVVPFLQLSLGRLPIDHVTIGPALNPRLSEEGLRILLTQAGYEHVITEHSIIPFRL